MNANESECFARRAASKVTDPLSRASLAEKLREAAAICTGAQGGLHLAAADLGVCVDSGVEAHLKLAETILTELADHIAQAQVFMSQAERDDLEQDKLARYADYERNPLYAVTRDQLDQYAAEAYAAGLEQREAVLA
ncbi:hypothetical protein [Dactylosporangium salmoneum]|uniref:Uncharacterized protein n=1 Tax=Dactylosporangium salmoneum TaxID=53361 RepID=A0ABP5T9L6_9ACTN